MKVLVSGSNGLIGSALTRNLESSGHDVHRLLRPQSPSARNGVMWDPAAGTLDPHHLEGFDAVVHLAGENIANKRWSPEQMARIRDSRVGSTALLAAALARLDSPPSVFVCASAGGYYGDRGDALLDEDAPPGDGFMATNTKDWEDAATAAASDKTRVVQLRIGVVLTAAGGMLSRVLPIFKFGLGGRLGSGKQYMSWLTRADVVDAAVWALEHEDISGPVNVSTPNPVTNSEFTRALGRVLHRPALFFVPTIALRIMQGDLSQVVTSSARMDPVRLTASGYKFNHPKIEGALTWALTDTAR